MDRVGFECAGSVGLGCIGGTVVSDPAGSALDLTERLRSIAPEYIDLVTAATDAQFENAFVAILEKKLAALERSKREYQEVGEVGLTAFLVAALSVPGLTASQEMHSAGHVDITVEADHCVPVGTTHRATWHRGCYGRGRSETNKPYIGRYSRAIVYFVSAVAGGVFEHNDCPG